MFYEIINIKVIEKMSRKLYNNRDKIRRWFYGKWNLYRNKEKNRVG